MNKENLRLKLEAFGVSNKLEELEELQKDTLATNEKFNLTAIKDEEKFRELMILDSLYPLSLVDFSNKKIIDVGTGAGYPGLPLAICSTGKFTLLDSTKKKVDHINEYVKTRGFLNVSAINARAEEYARNHKESYDIAIARAVASLNVLLELCLPLVKVDGYFIAMKGAKGFEEIEEAKNALKELDSEIVEIMEVNLPESGEKRILILIQKKKKTKSRYPREYKDISNKPL